ncbi:hypothetical protein Bbelb_082060 [Branchiostoma belcheri]|nr:hypothetical protein Bbelb_082060 [Branchiostoma belcheri]
MHIVPAPRSPCGLAALGEDEDQSLDSGIDYMRDRMKRNDNLQYSHDRKLLKNFAEDLEDVGDDGIYTGPRPDNWAEAVLDAGPDGVSQAIRNIRDMVMGTSAHRSLFEVLFEQMEGNWQEGFDKISKNMALYLSLQTAGYSACMAALKTKGDSSEFDRVHKESAAKLNEQLQFLQQYLPPDDEDIDGFFSTHDTWCRLKKRVAADFFDHINQIDDNIKFTQEPSHDNMLPFLDTKTIVEEDGNLRFEVYRKPTHTDQYLAFDSHHPLEHKLATLSLQTKPKRTNIDTSEVPWLNVATKTGLSTKRSNQSSDQSKKTQKCKPLTNKNKANITIPYVQGVSEKLRRIFQNFNIATNFKPHSTLRQRLVHPKDRPHKGTKANVIYRLKCEEPSCNNTYIGETSRPLKVRYKEHCRPSANGYSSAIFHHLQHNQGHSFKLESTDILDRETRWWERGVKEAIYERMYNPTLNREGGLRVDLSGTWDLALPAPRTDNT